MAFGTLRTLIFCLYSSLNRSSGAWHTKKGHLARKRSQTFGMLPNSQYKARTPQPDFSRLFLSFLPPCLLLSKVVPLPRSQKPPTRCRSLIIPPITHTRQLRPLRSTTSIQLGTFQRRTDKRSCLPYGARQTLSSPPRIPRTRLATACTACQRVSSRLCSTIEMTRRTLASSLTMTQALLPSPRRSVALLVYTALSETEGTSFLLR